MTYPLPNIFDGFYPRCNKNGFTIDLDYEDHGLFYHKLDLLIDDRYAVKVSFPGELPKENSGIIKRIKWCVYKGDLESLAAEIREWVEVIISMKPCTDFIYNMLKMRYACYIVEIGQDMISKFYTVTFRPDNLALIFSGEYDWAW